MSAYIFNYQLDFKNLNFREQPHLYRIGKGEQGVLLVEPYKSELLPLWRFKTLTLAEQSAQAIYEKFKAYLAAKDFVGADMARKYLQMGFTRARRYANHRSGRKYDTSNPAFLPAEYPHSQGSPYKALNKINTQETDALTNEKAKAATVFKEYWFLAKQNPDYQSQKADFVAAIAQQKWG